MKFLSYPVRYLICLLLLFAFFYRSHTKNSSPLSMLLINTHLVPQYYWKITFNLKNKTRFLYRYTNLLELLTIKLGNALGRRHRYGKRLYVFVSSFYLICSLKNSFKRVAVHRYTHLTVGGMLQLTKVHYHHYGLDVKSTL